MPKHIVRVSWSKGQSRINIPKAIIEELDWHGVKYLILKAEPPNYLSVRRFIDGESLEDFRAQDTARAN